MRRISLGTITLCINAQANGVHLLSYEEDQLVAQQLVEQVEIGFKQQDKLRAFSFELVSVERGCLLAGFEIYVALGMAGTGVLVAAKLIKDYSSYRASITQLFKDIRYVVNPKTGIEHSSCIYLVNLRFSDELKKLKSESDDESR